MKLYWLLVTALLSCIGFAGAQDQFNDSGIPSYGSFHGSNFDSVMLQNGNLHATVPVLSVAERGRTFSWKYIYDIKRWIATFVSHPTPGHPNGGFYAVGPVNDSTSGWRLAPPFLWSSTYV